jgi:chromosome segregation ATPase
MDLPQDLELRLYNLAHDWGYYDLQSVMDQRLSINAISSVVNQLIHRNDQFGHLVDAQEQNQRRINELQNQLHNTEVTRARMIAEKAEVTKRLTTAEKRIIQAGRRAQKFSNDVARLKEEVKQWKNSHKDVKSNLDYLNGVNRQTDGPEVSQQS